MSPPPRGCLAPGQSFNPFSFMLVNGTRVKLKQEMFTTDVFFPKMLYAIVSRFSRAVFGGLFYHKFDFNYWVL